MGEITSLRLHPAMSETMLEGRDLGLVVSEISPEYGFVIAKDENTFDCLRVESRVRVLANHSCS
jgi:hypothetical protein